MKPKSIQMPAGSTLSDAKRAALKQSKMHPGWYITVFSCFGLFLSFKNRLHVFDPTDSALGCDWYCKGGKVKVFTTAQRIADDLATPTMS